MSHVIIGGNYYDHITDYLFAPTYGYNCGYPSYGYNYGSYPYYGWNYYWPWYGYGSYEYPYYGYACPTCGTNNSNNNHRW
jgi:hypothetical protein